MHRFTVIDNKTGKERRDVFVLTPEDSDVHRMALRVVEEGSRDIQLAQWLRRWIKNIHDKKTIKKKFAGPSEGGWGAEGRASARGE